MIKSNIKGLRDRIPSRCPRYTLSRKGVLSSVILRLQVNREDEDDMGKKKKNVKNWNGHDLLEIKWPRNWPVEDHTENTKSSPVIRKSEDLCGHRPGFLIYKLRKRLA